MSNQQESINIWRNFVSAFYARNDTAHMLDHADVVCNEALSLNAKLESGKRYSSDIVIAAAYLHDIYAAYRDDHHLLAADFVHCCGSLLPMTYSKDDLQLIENAVREHRASWSGGWSSLLSELIATADRGKPGEIGKYMLRAYDYSRSKLLNPHTESLMYTACHVKDKWGGDGYAVYPPLYSTVYKDELVAQQDWLDSHTVEEIITILSDMVITRK